MEQAKPAFETFLLDVHPALYPFLLETHEYLLQNGCKVEIKTAKNGYVVSYFHIPSKLTLANYVFRKKGLVIRIYGNHVKAYEGLLASLPAAMQKTIEKAPACRRLLDPAVCNPHCPMGNVFTLGGEVRKKCRYTCFMFPLEAESNPHIRMMLEQELACRTP